MKLIHSAVRVVCLLLLLCALPAGALGAQAAFDPNTSSMETMIAEAYMQARYSRNYRVTRLVRGEGSVRVLSDTSSKPGDRLIDDAFFDYPHDMTFDIQSAHQVLQGRLALSLNELYTVHLSRYKGPELIEFEGIETIETIGTHAQAAAQTPWSYVRDKYTFSPSAFAVRPFVLRDGDGYLSDGCVYLYVYMLSPGRDVAWICSRYDIVTRVATALTHDRYATFAFRGLALPEGYVRVTSSNPANVRATDNAGSRILTVVSRGEEYACLGRTPSGWYRIELDFNKIGYISPKVATFYPR